MLLGLVFFVSKMLFLSPVGWKKDQANRFSILLHETLLPYVVWVWWAQIACWSFHCMGHRQGMYLSFPPTQSPTTASRWWESLQQRDEALGREGAINHELLSALPTALGCQMIAYSLLPPTRFMPPPAFWVLCGWCCGLASWWVSPANQCFSSSPW